MNGSMPPDPLAPDPTLAPVLDPEAQRRKVAMALQYARGLQKPSPIGDFANMALQMWNMKRRMPGTPPPSQGPMQPPASPIDWYGGGG